jgi:hypothetical protein
MYKGPFIVLPRLPLTLGRAPAVVGRKGDTGEERPVGDDNGTPSTCLGAIVLPWSLSALTLVWLAVDMWWFIELLLLLPGLSSTSGYRAWSAMLARTTQDATQQPCGDWVCLWGLPNRWRAGRRSVRNDYREGSNVEPNDTGARSKAASQQIKNSS